MRISLVVAAAENNVIGVAGGLPWKLPNDLKFFRDLTLGKPVIMGRKTFESIGRALPDRKNIVISRDEKTRCEGCTVVHSFEDAMEEAGRGDAHEAFVIGGGQLFEQVLPLADRIYLTRVHAVIEGDTLFPSLDADTWEQVSREEHAADARHMHDYTFFLYERRKKLV